jgi:hypothetical protein
MAAIIQAYSQPSQEVSSSDLHYSMHDCNKCRTLNSIFDTWILLCLTYNNRSGSQCDPARSG